MSGWEEALAENERLIKRVVEMMRSADRRSDNVRAAVLSAARETLSINGAPAPGDSDEVEFQARRIADRTIATLHGKPAPGPGVITCGGVDITDHVAAMYDAIVHSLDWGSRFLCVEEIESILTVAELAGFDNPTSTPTFKDGAISDSDFGAWHAQVRAKARAMLHEGGREPVADKHGPANTQQGAATPGHGTSDQAALDRADLDQAAGNVAEPQIDPTAHRVDHPPSSTITDDTRNVILELIRIHDAGGAWLQAAAMRTLLAAIDRCSPDPTIRAVVAWLRNHAAADFDGAVAEEKTMGSTRYAYVKQQTARVLADRIEAGDWRRFLAKEG